MKDKVILENIQKQIEISCVKDLTSYEYCLEKILKAYQKAFENQQNAKIKIDNKSYNEVLPELVEEATRACGFKYVGESFKDDIYYCEIQFQ